MSAVMKEPQISRPVAQFIGSPKKLLIDGKWLPAVSEATFEVKNPASGATIARAAEGDKLDVDAAVRAARRAFESGPWPAMTASERSKILWRVGDLISKYTDELAELESLDNGKPMAVARVADVPLAADIFQYMAGWCTKIEGKTIPLSVLYTPGVQYHSYTRPEPIGVVGQIIPWNLPLLMAAWKLAPALATGNTCVLKPAETTSITALHLAEIFQRAELPDGVVNIVTGAGETGRAIVEHPKIDKIAFTGSTEVGKRILHSVAGTKKKLTLELGGKAANIIFEDAPIDQAIEGIISGIYFNQGHVCCAGSRLFVQEGIFAPVIRKLRDRISTLRLGNPLDKNTDIGAINSRMQLDKICELADSGVRQGAELVQSPARLPAKGYWYPPSFFTGVTMSHRIAQEEIFGPVLSVMTFRTPEEAIERANNTPYGLIAGVWIDKGSKIFKIVNQLRAGVVWANTYNKFDPASPFGGYKESGFGREGGLHGLLPYLSLT